MGLWLRRGRGCMFRWGHCWSFDLARIIIIFGDCPGGYGFCAQNQSIELESTPITDDFGLLRPLPGFTDSVPPRISMLRNPAFFRCHFHAGYHHTFNLLLVFLNALGQLTMGLNKKILPERKKAKGI